MSYLLNPFISSIGGGGDAPNIPADANWSNVIAQMSFEDILNSEWFYDEGPGVLSVTNTGGTTVSTGQRYGESAIDFSGATNLRMEINDGASFVLSSDWTVSFSWQSDTLAGTGNRQLCGKWQSASGKRGFILRLDFDTNELVFIYSTDGNDSPRDEASFTPSVDTNYDFDIVHDASEGANGTVYVYVNQTLTLTVVLTGALHDTDVDFQLGSFSGSGDGQVGTYDNLRIVQAVETATAREHTVQSQIHGLSSWWIYPIASIDLNRLRTSVCTPGAAAASVSLPSTPGGSQWALSFDPGSKVMVHRERLHSGYGQDDHNAAAIKRMGNGQYIVVYTGHAPEGDQYLRYRIGDDLDSLGSESTLSTGGATELTYAQIFTFGSDVYIFSRAGSDQNTWVFWKSTDNGSTWSSSTSLIAGYLGSGGTRTPELTYISGRKISSTTIRFFAMLHPAGNRQLRCFDVNVSTGDVTSAGGNLGNIYSGWSVLEMDDADTDLAEILDDDGAASDAIRLLDVADDGEAILFCHFNEGGSPYGGEYRRLELTGSDPFTPGDWTQTTIADSGEPFYVGSSYYFGGAQFDRVAGGHDEVYTAEEDAGTWYIRKRATSDGGSTYPVGSTVESSSDMLIRPICPQGANSDCPVIYQRIHGTYPDFKTWTRGVTKLG